MSLIDTSRVESAINRLAALRADSIPHWGRMTPLGMVEHLSNSLEIALGLRTAAMLVPSWLAPVLRTVGMLPLPTPRRMPSTPEFLAPRGENFEAARQSLILLLRRFHRDVLTDPTATHDHPVFGAMNRLQWADLQDRHIRHHLGQFGL